MNTKPIVVEYLIIILQEDTFCDSDVAFLKFLSVDSSLSISERDKTITLNSKKKNKFNVSYSLTSNLVTSQQQRYFKFTLSSIENNLNEFTELTNLLEKLISKLHKDVSINILWNDIARKYAIEGYELINEVENLLRRLIANFMLINVGYDWHKSHIPLSVESRENHLKETYSDYLHQTYFSDLKTILFEGQRDFELRDIGQVQRLVEKHISEKKAHISIDDLKGIISKSLWEKHFAKDSEYRKKDLEDDLDKLNSLRNEIAHNRHISRETLGKIQNLSKKVIKTLRLEIDDLPNKILTTEEKKFQVETEISRIADTNPRVHEYMTTMAVVGWYRLQYGLEQIHQEVRLSNDDKFIDIVIELDNNECIASEVKSTNFSGFRQIRNQIAHGKYIDRFLPKNLDTVKEFHIVFVIRDYIVGADLTFANELAQLFNSINPKVRVFFGVINENGIFEKI
jgi:hypothetical protein